jgi:hypothetical protein
LPVFIADFESWSDRLSLQLNQRKGDGWYSKGPHHQSIEAIEKHKTDYDGINHESTRISG